MTARPVVIVTGASRGLGAAVARCLGTQGAAVVLVARTAESLAAEEPTITAVAVRPGVVDTDMQVELRDQGDGGMPAEQVAYYRRLKSEKRLEQPQVTGRAIAWLALYAPLAWSGRFINYDDPEIPVSSPVDGSDGW